MKIELNMTDDQFEYLLYTLEVARREISQIERYSKNIRQLHLERLDKLIAEFDKYFPENKRYPLPEIPSAYEKKLIDGWRDDGYSDKEIAEFLVYF